MSKEQPSDPSLRSDGGVPPEDDAGGSLGTVGDPLGVSLATLNRVGSDHHMATAPNCVGEVWIKYERVSGLPPTGEGA